MKLIHIGATLMAVGLVIILIAAIISSLPETPTPTHRTEIGTALTCTRTPDGIVCIESP